MYEIAFPYSLHMFRLTGMQIRTCSLETRPTERPTSLSRTFPSRFHAASLYAQRRHFPSRDIVVAMRVVGICRRIESRWGRASCSEIVDHEFKHAGGREGPPSWAIDFSKRTTFRHAIIAFLQPVQFARPGCRVGLHVITLSCCRPAPLLHWNKFDHMVHIQNRAILLHGPWNTSIILAQSKMKGPILIIWQVADDTCKVNDNRL